MASSVSILLVEDDPAWQETLGEIIKEKGCTFQVVSSYGEAFDRFLTEAFDLVVIDLRLGPEENNRDGVALLQDAYEKGIPAVVVTGYGTPDVIKKADRYDALRVMHKGKFGIEQFKRVVDKVISATGSEPSKPAPQEVKDINELLRKLVRGELL